MADFERRDNRANFGGWCANAPPDDPRLREQSKYAIAQNVRSYTQGRIETRLGLTKRSITAAAEASRPVHSIHRLSDPLNVTWTRIVGAGTNLFRGAGAALGAAIDTGFSGDPLSMVPWEPERSPDSWLYVGDRTKMVKVRGTGTIQSIGIIPPRFEPAVTFGAPATTNVDGFQAADIAGWAGDGTKILTPPVALTGGAARITTTVTASVADVVGGPAAQWYTIYPASIVGILPGTFVSFGTTGGANKLVQTVRPAAFTTTVGSITYDAGVVGDCSIQPAVPVDIDVDSLVYLNATEYVRVQAVISAPDGTVQSFRCSTVGTIAATQALAGVASFRAYCAAAPTGTVIRDAMRATFGNGITGVGTLTKTAVLNLGYVGTRAILDEDEIHCSLRMSNLSSLIEGKLMLNVDPADATFTFNCYVWTFRSSDLQATVTDASTLLAARTQIVQRSVIETPPEETPPEQLPISYDVEPIEYNIAEPVVDPQIGVPGSDEGTLAGAPISAQTGIGQAQWMELRLKIKNAVRVGTASERTLQNVAKIRISLNMSTTGAADTADLDAWWIGGTYGPDIGDTGTPYVYRYRGRSSTTGARSNAGPPIRLGGGVMPRRQSCNVFLDSMPSLVADATNGDLSWTQVDRIDVYRFGGSLNDWRLLGAVINDSTIAQYGITFTDNYPDDWAANQPLLETDQDKPFPIVGRVATGTCTVAGTSVTRTAGDLFNLLWDAGNIIQINGIDYVFHNRPTTTSKAEIEENGGTQAGVPWTVYAPLTLGQPLPCLWGPLEGIIFSCGDPINPGRLYWMNGNNPDAASQGNYFDVTAPSEPLQNGCMYDGFAWLWSTDRMFRILLTGDSTFPVRVIEVPNSQGLYTRWGFAVGPKIFQLGKDGIYATTGGEPQSLTDNDLLPWLPNEGNPGIIVNGIAPPDLSYAHADTRVKDFRLCWYDDYLYFDYRDITGCLGTAWVNLNSGSWGIDYFGSTTVMHYGEKGTLEGFNAFPGAAVHQLLIGGTDGGAAGAIFQVLGTDDDGVGIFCRLRTSSDDQGFLRANKLYRDSILDADARGGAGFTVTAGFDNYATLLPPAILGAGSAVRTQYKLDLPNAGAAAGQGQIARNAALDLTWTGPAYIYGWNFAFALKPENSFLGRTDPSDLGYPGAKWIQGLILEADTNNVARSVDVYADTGIAGTYSLQTTLVVTHNGQVEIPYSFTPFTAHNVVLVPTDAGLWRYFKARWVWEPEPELTTHWISQPTSLDFETYSHIRDILLPIRSAGAATLTLYADGVALAPYTIPTTAGVATKVYLVGLPRKAKLWQFDLRCPSGVRVYLRDLSVRAKPWGDAGPYHSLRPFGDLSREGGARI